MRVDNRGILRKLTWRTLKAGRFRNAVAIFAIALTAVLFTGIATMGGALLQTVQETTFRQVGSSAHGGLKYLTQEQYDRIEATGEYVDISYDIIAGFATDPVFSKKQHEVRFAEDKKAQWGFSYPTVGHMPKEYKDIALADTALDLLGLPQTLGQTVHLAFDVNGTQHEDDFTLVGIYPGDDVMAASQIYLSRAYIRDAAPTPAAFDGEHMGGVLNADVWFDNSINVEQKLQNLVAAAGYDPADFHYGMNWGYTASGELDFTTVLLVAGLLAIVMLSGYLIIYSIFAISVSGDIQFYGLLKTVGATGRQIRRIVRGQALMLSAVGIPIGLALGFVLGVRLAPVMMEITSFSAPQAVRANPLIFLFAAVFSLVTVFLSCRRPGRMAAKVSPVEALRYTEGDAKAKKTGRRARRVTPLTMAWANIWRSKKKLATVLLSLSLSLVLLNSVVSMVQGFDMDEYLKTQMVSDFLLTDASVLNPVSTMRNFAALPPEVEDEVAALPGLERVSRVLFRDVAFPLEDGALRARFESVVRPFAEKEGGNYPQALALDLAQQVTMLHAYGLDEFGFESLEQNFQNVDWATFNSGNYALMCTFDESDGAKHPERALYDIGDKIPLADENGTITEYELLGFAAYPYAISCQHSHLTDFTVILPAGKMAEVFDGQPPMSLIFNVDNAHMAETEAWLQNLCETEMPGLNYRSKAFYMAEFAGVQRMFLVLGGVLAFILGLIGVLNFVNTTATSIMTRKRELAMLQSVGMTGRQMKTMLFGEGAWYAVLTLALVLTLGTAVGAGLVRGIAGSIWFFRFRFTLVPALVCAPILLALCVLIPLLCAKLLQRESIVDRLREN